MRPLTRFGELALPVKILPGFGNGGENLLKQDVVPRVSLLSVGQLCSEYEYPPCTKDESVPGIVS